MQGPSFGGGKRPEPGNSLPGPGAYNTLGAEEAKQRPQTSRPTIGSTKRPDIWNTQNVNPQGPAYNTKGGAFDNADGKGARFSKASRNKQVESTPGPGAYVGEGSFLKGAGAGRIGNTKRKDHFTSKGVADLPGPGNYGEAYSSFSKTQKIPLGGKYKTLVNETPGPGSYVAQEPDRQRKGGTMGTQARKDPFEASKRAAAEQPGPGNYVENTDTFGKGKAVGFGSKYK